MADDGEVTSVTAPVDLEIVDDRLLFTLTSGGRSRTYDITFHRARTTAHAVLALLDKRDRERAQGVVGFHRKAPRKGV